MQIDLGAGGTGIKTLNIATNATPANIINIGGAASTTNIGSVKNTIGIAGTTNGNGVRLGNSRLTINKPLAPVIGLTGDYTASVTEIFEAGIFGFSAANGVAPLYLTLPSAQGSSGLVQALPGTPAVGDVFTFYVYETTKEEVFLVGGAGVTIVNNNEIKQDKQRCLIICRVTSVIPGSETISVY